MNVNIFLQFNFHRMLSICIAFLAMTLLSGCNPLGEGKSVVDPGFAPGGGITIPDATLNLSISSARRIKLQWSATPVSNITYKVLRSTSLNSAYSEIYSSSTQTSFEDSGLPPGTEYFYKVQYISYAGVEAETSVRSGTPIDGFTVTHTTASSGRVDFVFPAVMGSQSYSVRFGTSSGNYGGEVPLDYQGFITGLTNGVTYYFLVLAKNTVGAVSATNEVSVLVNPQNIASLEFATTFSPTTNSSDDVFSTQAVINARDYGGLIYTVDSTSSITLTAYNADNCAGSIVMNGLSGTTTQTLASGVATFTDIKALRPTIKSIRASLGPITICSANLTITPGVAATLAITSGNGQSAVVSSTLNPFTVTLKDAQDNLLSGQTINWLLTTGSGTLSAASSTTNASGVATSTLTLGSVNGSRGVSATVDGTSLTQDFNASAMRGAPASMSVVAGASQTAMAGSTLPTNYEVLITDSEANPIPGLSVNWAVTSNGGAFSVMTSVTDSSGIATQSLTLGTLAGSNTSTATLSTNTAINASFSAMGTSGPATQFAISSGQNQSEVVRSVLSPFTVTLKDALGNPLLGETVDWVLTTGTGSLSTASSTTNSLGVATTTLTLGTVNGPRVVTATVYGTSFTQTFNVTGRTGAPASMTVQTGASQTALAGSTLPANFEVLITDSDGNPIPNQAVSWTVTTNGGSFAGASTLTNSSGIASQTLTLGTAAGANTASATLTSNTSLNQSFTATGTVGPATQFSVSSGQSQSEVVRSVLNPFAVVVKDALNNVIPGAQINWTLSSGTGTLSGATSLTNSSGTGSSTLTFGTSSGARVVTANVDGTALNLTFNATGRPGTPAVMTVQSGAGQTAIAGSTLPTSYEVLVTDSDSNPIPSLTVNWTVNTNGGSFGAATSVTNSSGVASQTLTLGNAAGSNTSTAALNTNASVNATFSATGTVGPPTQISISAGQTQSGFLTEALGTAFKVVIKDARNNLVSGATIDWTKSSGTLGAASTTTNSSGEATNSLTIASVAGDQTVVAKINGTTTSVTFNVTAKVTAPTTLAATLSDSSTTLSFSAVTGAESYKILRSTTAGSGHALITTVTTNSYTDSSLTNGTTYYYIVKATNTSIDSLSSSEVSIRPAAIPSAPLTLAGTTEKAQTVLTWVIPSTGTTSFKYNVYRSSSINGTYSSVVTDLTTLTYTDTGLTNGTTYYYKVAATNTVGEGAMSTELAITPDVQSGLSFDFKNHSSFQSHNLLSDSENFLGTSWSGDFIGSIVATDRSVAPDGTLTADKLIATTATSSHLLGQSFSAVTGVPYTFSLYVKKGEVSTMSILFGAPTLWTGGISPRIYFNIDTGSITTTNGTIDHKSIYSVGNGWYRISLTATPASSGTILARIAHPQSLTAGDGVSGFYLWGAQLENNPGISRYVAGPAAYFGNPLTSTKGSATLNFSRTETTQISTVIGSDGLVRFSPHNKSANSQAVDSWTKSATTVVADQIAAPDGTVTADKLLDTITNVQHYANNAFSATLGKTYTSSVFLKAGERTKAFINLSATIFGSPAPSAYVDLSACALFNTPANNLRVSSTSVGNGWCRFSITQVATATGANSFAISLVNAAGTPIYAGDGTSGFYVWGLQTEENSYASSYVPTTTIARYDSPRFDFDPDTLAPKGLLIEDARTNLMSNSGTLSSFSYLNASSTFSLAPDGTTTARTFTFNTAAANRTFIDMGSSNGTYTVSVWAKGIAGSSATVVNLFVKDKTSDTVRGNGANVTLSTTKWTRVSVTGTTVGATPGLRFEIRSNGPVDATNTLLLWGAQVENAEGLSSYIPTTSSVTRNMEQLNLPVGTWFSSTASSWNIEYSQPVTFPTTATHTILRSNNAGTDYVRLRSGNTSTLCAQTVVAGAIIDNLCTPAVGADTTVKLMWQLESAANSFIVGGTTIGTSTSTGYLVPTTFYFGSSYIATESMNGYFKKIRYYPENLPSADSLRLTQ